MKALMAALVVAMVLIVPAYPVSAQTSPPNSNPCPVDPVTGRQFRYVETDGVWQCSTGTIGVWDADALENTVDNRRLALWRQGIPADQPFELSYTSSCPDGFGGQRTCPKTVDVEGRGCRLPWSVYAFKAGVSEEESKRCIYVYQWADSYARAQAECIRVEPGTRDPILTQAAACDRYYTILGNIARANQYRERSGEIKLFRHAQVITTCEDVSYGAGACMDNWSDQDKTECAANPICSGPNGDHTGRASARTGRTDSVGNAVIITRPATDPHPCDNPNDLAQGPGSDQWNSAAFNACMQGL